MPETVAQWCWFAFFAGGALGGWAVVAAVVAWAVQTIRVQIFLWRLMK